MKWFACVVETENDLGGSFVVQSRGKAGTITDNFYTGQKISIADDWAKGFRLYLNDKAPKKNVTDGNAAKAFPRDGQSSLANRHAGKKRPLSSLPIKSEFPVEVSPRSGTVSRVLTGCRKLPWQKFN